LKVWNINKDAAMPNTVSAVDPVLCRDSIIFLFATKSWAQKEILISLSLTEPN